MHEVYLLRLRNHRGGFSLPFSRFKQNLLRVVELENKNDDENKKP